MTQNEGVVQIINSQDERYDCIALELSVRVPSSSSSAHHELQQQMPQLQQQLAGSKSRSLLHLPRREPLCHIPAINNATYHT